MPRENSISDEADGRSLTPDLEFPANHNDLATPSPDARPKSPHSQKAPPSHSPNHVALSPADRFRVSVRKVIQLHRASSIMITGNTIGAEPGIDPQKDSANLMWGHVRLVSLVVKQALKSMNRWVNY